MRVGTAVRATVTSGNPMLAEGARGPAVSDLQRRLAAAGFSPGNVDGDFGPKTRAAVVAFQRARGLDADGIVGPNTWSALLGASPARPAPALASGRPTLRLGAKGGAVSELQRLLARAGVNPGNVDGDFGPKTLAAVVAFQRARGLDADGIVGPRTWAALDGGSSFDPAPRPTPAPAPAPSSHPQLSLGARGPAVAELQQLLAAAGCDPGGADGQFGPMTAAAVRRFQASRGLDVDGVVGSQTWSALLARAPATNPVGPGAGGDVRQRILDLARGELGTSEATNRNDGAVAKYPNYFGRGAESYCADFVSWVLTNAGVDMNDPWCPSIVSTAKREGRWKSSPEPGDLVLFDWDSDGVSDHVGLVEAVNADGSVNTIEGNTGNPATGVEGVWRRTRGLGTIMGFANPA